MAASWVPQAPAVTMAGYICTSACAAATPLSDLSEDSWTAILAAACALMVLAGAFQLGSTGAFGGAGGGVFMAAARPLLSANTAGHDPWASGDGLVAEKRCARLTLGVVSRIDVEGGSTTKELITGSSFEIVNPVSCMDALTCGAAGELRPHAAACARTPAPAATAVLHRRHDDGKEA
jgi:hypothetical protein